MVIIIIAQCSSSLDKIAISLVSAMHAALMCFHVNISFPDLSFRFIENSPIVAGSLVFLSLEFGVDVEQALCAIFFKDDMQQKEYDCE